MPEGQRINLTFLHFDIENQSTCSYDEIELDMTTFISRHCGSIDKSWSIISSTNILNMRFRSDYSVRKAGFLAVWSATTEPPTYSTISGCNNCVFPFQYGNTTFDTCINVEDVDDQPWCSPSENYNNGPPVEEGTHLFPSISSKVFCFDSDSSCPSTAAKKLITSPEFPQSYPNNADQVCKNKLSSLSIFDNLSIDLDTFCY